MDSASTVWFTMANRNLPNYTLRPQLRDFANRMEHKLRQNDHKGGWQDCASDWLLRRLEEELQELRIALATGTLLDVEEEAADVANFAMMLADQMKRRLP